ncbi:hypothetical protein OOJ09_28685 [Mesorhizobium qingshengii]|uniref:Mercuric ion transport protein n=1 Tax=Mesorhizobium qingshengii TaxID=1165689 RepID=A0ABT4R2V3_9HYPH|nr:hypothetical protein [Mesorhizobium qingshengii]MCZ8548171.1 hypothetical protein [Mesorhizobium qingshengii]
MNIGKTNAGTGLFLGACTVCCAPLIGPPIIAAIAAGGLGLALVGQLGLALGVVAAGGFFLLSRRKAAPNADFQTLMAAGQCGCGPSCEEKPIACTLDAGDFKERAAGILDLARRSLRHASRTPLTLSLTYEPKALDDIRDLVAKEKTCCAFLTFDLTNDARGVFLTITAPQSAADSADLLFESFAPELAASNLKETA